MLRNASWKQQSLASLPKKSWAVQVTFQLKPSVNQEKKYLNDVLELYEFILTYALKINGYGGAGYNCK